MTSTHYVRASAVALGASLAAAGLLVVPQSATAATTIVVGNPATCGPTDFNTIQAAVNAASTGDTIQVCAGNYGEKVTIDTPGLTLRGVAAGTDPRTAPTPAPRSLVHDVTGVFVLTANADDTTITGFTISDASNRGATGVSAFSGSSGLTLTDNIIRNNGNGVFLANPDGDDPTTISRNKITNNSANFDSSGQSGSGVFICCGAGNSVQIVDNAFSRHTETAINTAGDSANPSEGIVIAGNTSTNDATFAVVTNSIGAVLESNRINTRNAAVPSGSFGTGILDFGSNTGLRIVSNTMVAVGSSSSSGINVRNFTGTPSTGTSVIGNSVTGWANNVRVDDGSRIAYVANNKLRGALVDGILVGSSIKQATFSRNTVTGAGTFSCEDRSTGRASAGTANTWRGNTGDTASSPVAICPTSS